MDEKLKADRLVRQVREALQKPPATMAEKIEALTEIPANEQCLGHFQLAVQDILRELEYRIAALPSPPTAEK